MRKVKRIHEKGVEYEHVPAKVFAIGLKGFMRLERFWPILCRNT